MSNITFKKVSKVFDKKNSVIKDFNLNIQDKEFLVIVGPSGCGKSTVLRMLAGLETISSGEIYIAQHLVNSIESKDRNVAMVFQNYALYPHMSVYNNIAFALKIRNIKKKEIKQKVLTVAKLLEIEKLLKKKPRQLSGGQRQRVALGRAMVRSPSVFLFDEPLSNLDAKLRETMRLEIRKLHHQSKTTFVYVTHDQTEAMALGDRIVVMNEGIIQQIATPKEIYDSPNNLFVAGFIGVPQMNFLEGILNYDDKTSLYYTVVQNRITYFPHIQKNKIMDEYIGQDIIIGIRPEHLIIINCLSEKRKEGMMKLKVKHQEMIGHSIYLYLDSNQKNIVGRVDRELNFKNNQSVYVCLNTDKVHLFDPKTGCRIV